MTAPLGHSSSTDAKKTHTDCQGHSSAHQADVYPVKPLHNLKRPKPKDPRDFNRELAEFLAIDVL